MTDFFRAPDRIAALESECRTWLGTPWCPNSDAKGKDGGVSCHNLPRSIYVALGAVSEAFPKVIGDPTLTRHSKVSVMEPWLDSRPEFVRLTNKADCQPGDLVGLRIYSCCDHLAIALRDSKMIHVLMRKHTAIDGISSWANRIVSIWRPVEIV